MKKHYLLSLILFINLITFNALSQINPPLEAHICQDNAFGIRFDVPPQPFNFSIDAKIYNGLIPVSFPFPDCHVGLAASNNPVHIEMPTNINLTPTCTLTISSPVINQSVYTWSVAITGTCPSPMELYIDYIVRLDCSLVPAIPTSQLPLTLEQIFTVSGGVPTYTDITPVPFPHILNSPTVTVAGNPGQISDMIFAYENNGYADVYIEFEFVDTYRTTCTAPAYKMEPINASPVYYLSGNSTPHNLVSGYGNHIIVHALETLYIKQHIKITGCTTICPGDQNVEFKWRCYNMNTIPPAGPGFCDECQQQYITPFIFDTEPLTYTITRLLPSPTGNPDVAEYDNSCMEGIPIPVWKAVITNTCTYTTLPTCTVHLENPSYGTNGLAVVYNNLPTPLKSCSCPNFSAVIQYNGTLNSQAACYQNGAYLSEPEFDVVINNFPPGETVTFEFPVYKCCGTNAVTNQNKAFNQWGISSQATNGCGNLISPVSNSMAINALGGISSHSNSSDDLNLQASFSPSYPLDLTVPTQSGIFFGPFTNQHIDLTGMFGDAFDKQELGFDNGANMNMTGIIRAQIHCEQGLVLNNTNDVSFTIPLTALTWNPVSFYTDNALSPQTCVESNYYFDYDLSAVADPELFFNTGRFNFTLQSCCDISSSPTHYTVSFSLLMNDNCYTYTTNTDPLEEPACTSSTGGSCCWLPLASKGYFINVHCPGCAAPGIIVDDYRLQRNSYGYKDADNNRVADGTSPVTITPTNYLPEFNLINRDASVHGDELVDRLNAHFFKGEDAVIPYAPTDPDYHGYEYQSKMVSNGVYLNVLQLKRTIQYSESAKMNLRIISADLYVDENNSMNPDCEDCGDFPTVDPSQWRSLFKIHIPDADLVLPILERSGNDYLFTFTKSFIQGLPSGSSTINNYNFYNNGSFVYDEEQQYRLVVKYSVCGNTQSSSLYYADDADLKLVSSISNVMWLTGGGINGTGNGFTLSDLNGATPPLPMPNLVHHPTSMNNTLEGINLAVDPVHGYCPPCNLITQSNFADLYRFICETCGGTHNFYSTDINNASGYGPSSTTTCEKVISIGMNTSFGRNKFETGSLPRDPFPYEFRQPALFPDHLLIDNIPDGYHLTTGTNNGNIYSAYWNGINSWPPCTTQVNHFTVPPIVSGVTNSITFNSTLMSSLFSTLSCISGTAIPPCVTPVNHPLAGDNSSQQVIQMFLYPDCDVDQTYAVAGQHLNIVFSNNSSGCHTSPVNTCAYTPNQNNMAGPNYWTHPNPNLQVQFNPPLVNSITSSIHWSFTITNLPPSTPGYTAAYNVYLAIPTSSQYNFLSSWKIKNLTYLGIPYPQMTPSLGGIFGIIPIGTVDNFPLSSNSFITGELWADYTPCQNNPTYNPNWGWVSEIPIAWGWNCAGFPSSLADPNLCDQNPMNIYLHEEPVNLEVESTDQDFPNPGVVTLCTGNHKISACFRNLQHGAAYPGRIHLTGTTATNCHIDNVTLTNCNTGITVSLQQDANDPSYYNFSPGDLLAILLQNDYMGINDCICIEVEFTPQCYIDPNPLTNAMFPLPSIELEYNSYCNIGSAPPLLSITAPPDPAAVSMETACTDCFMITKTASAATVASGSELINYTITVWANNVQGTYDVDVLEGIQGSFGYPAEFSPVPPPGPFGPGGNTTILGVPITCPVGGGLGSTVVTAPSGTSSWSGPMQGTLSPVNGVFNVCNQVTLETPAGILLTSDPLSACVEIEQSCEDLHPASLITHIILDGDNVTVTPLNFQNYVVKGRFFINQNVTFSNRNFFMEPGAEIIVLSGNILTFRTSHLSACAKMWKGITLENLVKGTTLNIWRGSSLSDAYQGIYAKRGTIVSLSESNFPNNYVSLYVPPVASAAAKMNNTSVSIYYCNFYGNGPGTMLPMYTCPTCSIVSPDYPKAGIEINDMSLGLNSVDGINNFNTMSNGIIAYRSNLYSYNNAFSRIHADNTYTGQTGIFSSSGASFNGSAIFGTGQTDLSGIRAVKIDQRGYGNQPGVSFTTFDDCDFGIFDDNMELASRDNVMDNMGKAAYHSQLSQRRTHIADNFINSENTGIELLDYDQFTWFTRIENNEIHFGDAANNASSIYSYGIRAEGTNAFNSDQRNIYNNTIHYTQFSLNSYSGIRSNSAAGIHILWNRMIMWNNNHNQEGIYTTGGLYNITSCNVIEGDHHFYLDYQTPLPLNIQSAITAFNETDPEIGCNTTTGTNNGIYVPGLITGINNPVLIEGNDFNDHAYSFRYGLNASVTAPVEYRGNKWHVNTTLTSNGFNAFDQSSNNIPTFVNPALTDALPYSQDPNTWFGPGGGPFFNCYSPDYCSSLIPPQMAASVTDMDRMVAADILENDPFTEATRWMLKKALYKKADDNPSMLTDTLINQFYLANQNETFAELNPVEDAKTALFARDSIIDTLVQQNHADIYEKLNDISVQMVLLDTAVEHNDTLSIPGIVDAIDAIQEIITDNAEASDNATALKDGTRAIDADAVSIDNGFLSVNNTIEYNERTVNDIYLNTIANNQYGFTPQQKQALYNIAIQCPLAGGNAVFRARAIYALFDRAAFYNDYDICAQAGIALRKSKTEEKHIAKVFPNPANERITLEYEIPETETAKFYLLSATGQTLFSVDLKGGKRQYSFTTKTYLPAVYHYKFITNGQGVDNGKLIIVR